MKQLPQFFAIKKVDNPLWYTYIAWLNITYSANYDGNSNCYYGINYKGPYCNDSIDNFQNITNVTSVITLEEWDDIVGRGNVVAIDNRKYVVYVSNGNTPQKEYKYIEKAKEEAKRLFK